MEKMKQIPDFANFYITPKGQVYTTQITHLNKYGELKKLKSTQNNRGYFRICLMVNKKRYYKSIHRLVAETYLGATPETEVTHIKYDLSDNSVENLLCTNRSVICKRSFMRGREKVWLGKKESDHAGSKPVQQIKNGVVVNTFGSILEAEKKTGISKDRISRICNGCYAGHYKIDPDGYTWKFNEKA